MDVELQSIKILIQKKVNITIVTTRSCSYYTYIKSIRKFSSLNAVIYSHLRQSIAAVIKNKFFAGHVHHPVNVRKVPAKSLKHRFNNTRFIRKVLSIRSCKEQFYTFKIVNCNWLNFANS